jgi:hypothetical protein
MTRPSPLTILRLYTDARYEHTGTHLRGAILGRFPDRELLHNHTERPRLPPVRFVVEDGVPCVVAWGSGAAELLDLYGGLETLPTPHRTYEITGRELLQTPLDVGLVPEPRRYRSLSPWLALNQSNHEAWCANDAPPARRALLKRILTGNLLVTLSALGAHLSPAERLELQVETWRERPLRLRGTSYMGLEVTWEGNVNWSPWVGVGKQSAKGFGRFAAVEG